MHAVTIMLTLHLPVDNVQQHIVSMLSFFIVIRILLETESKFQFVYITMHSMPLPFPPLSVAGSMPITTGDF